MSNFNFPGQRDIKMVIKSYTQKYLLHIQIIWLKQAKATQFWCNLIFHYFIATYICKIEVNLIIFCWDDMNNFCWPLCKKLFEYILKLSV